MTRRQSHRVRELRDVAALLAIAAMALGCAPSGEDIRNRWDAHAPASGAYRIHYAVPPWEVVSENGDELFLRIRSNAMVMLGIDTGPGKFELRVATGPGDATSSADAARRDFASRGFTIDEPGRVVVADTAEQGVEVLATTETPVLRRFRAVRFPLGTGRVLQLDFEATPPLDTPEIDTMVNLVEIEPAP